MLDVLYEDNHLLVLNKPADLPTMGVQEQEPSLLRDARQYIKTTYNKPGNVYLGVVSRLDRMATGVLVFARTSKAASRLSEQIRAQQVHRRYWCLVARTPQPSHGELRDWVIKNDVRRRMETTTAVDASAKEAVLHYETVQRGARATLLRVRLQTGRKHQIRLQMATHIGPILGDRKYGSADRFPLGIALHARSLEIQHPTRKEKMQFTAPLPDYWDDFLPDGFEQE